MSVEIALARALRRDRWIVAACLVLACVVAWSWLFWQTRQMAPPATEMGGMGAMGPTPRPVAYLVNAFTMWSLMMVAMMLPSAAPMILIYARIAGDARRQGALAPTLLFAGVYLAIWAAFSLVAATAQSLLAQGGVLSTVRLAIGDARLAGLLLIVAGVYQATPLKHACLARCRSPAAFLMGEWRPGFGGSIRLGALHGLYCLGCCWLLMALLFVGGVMNLAWVAVLAVLVLVEKILPIGPRAALALAGLAIVAGIAMLIGVRVTL